MALDGRGFSRACLSAFLVLSGAAASAQNQNRPDESEQKLATIESLGLSAIESTRLARALDQHDYVGAEKILLPEINADPHSASAARRLDFVGSIYFLDHDYLNAVVAWKKAEAIAPLEPALRFSLAMAYIRIGRSRWARDVLSSLAVSDPKNALYPYWLGRLDYDGHLYNPAIQNFQQAIALDPSFARAYDNLGLCYYYQNDNQRAIDSYKRAIELDRSSAHPSAWPYLNLAITQQFLNQPREAEANVREAIRLDPSLPQAHFELGSILEEAGRLNEAVLALQEAARLDASYAEPHMAMARIYHKLGHESEAHAEVQTYLRLHPHSTPQ